MGGGEGGGEVCGGIGDDEDAEEMGWVEGVEEIGEASVDALGFVVGDEDDASGGGLGGGGWAMGWTVSGAEMDEGGVADESVEEGEGGEPEGEEGGVGEGEEGHVEGITCVG